MGVRVDSNGADFLVRILDGLANLLLEHIPSLEDLFVSVGHPLHFNLGEASVVGRIPLLVVVQDELLFLEVKLELGDLEKDTSNSRKWKPLKTTRGFGDSVKEIMFGSRYPMIWH